MKKVEEITINEEKIYLRKDFLGWHVIYPTNKLLVKNNLEPLDKKTNRKNLIAGGSWIKLIIVIGIVILLILAIIEYSTNTRIALECLNKSNTIINVSNWTLN